MHHRLLKGLTGTAAALVLTSTLALAEDAKTQSSGTMPSTTGTTSGTITKIDAVTGEFTVKDRDGKTYVLKKTDVVAQDLQTGDVVAYEIVEGVPVNIREDSSEAKAKE